MEETEKQESGLPEEVSAYLDYILNQNLDSIQGIGTAFNYIFNTYHELSKKLKKEGIILEESITIGGIPKAINLFWRDFSFISNQFHRFVNYSYEDIKELRERCNQSPIDTGTTGLAPSKYLSKTSHFTAAKILVNSSDADSLKDVIKDLLEKCVSDAAEEFKRNITQIKQGMIVSEETLKIHEEQTGEKESKPQATREESQKQRNEGLNMEDFLENGQINVSRLMQSDQFVEAIRKFDGKIRSIMIGLTIEYLLLHPDGFALPEMLDSMLKIKDDNYLMTMEYKKNLYNSILKKLKISPQEAETPEGRKQIYDYYVKNFLENGAVFHAFNGTLEKNIQKEGLSPDRRIWNYDEIDEVNDIFKKTGNSMVFGWLHINSKKGVFYDVSGRNIFHYACASPEWFAQFVSEGFHIEKNQDSKTSYYRRDYKKSRENIQKFLDKKGNKLTMEEKIKVLNLFEKFWKMLAHEGSHPKVALIPKKTVGRDWTVPLEDWERICMEQGGKTISSEELFRSIIGAGRHGTDLSTDKSIPPGQIKIIDLPDYEKIFGEKRGQTATKHEKFGEGIYRPEVLTGILKEENFNIKKLIDEFKKDPILKHNFEADAGVSERYTVEQHTEMVAGQFEKYFGHRPLPAGIGHDFMRLVMAIHDIGKPVALGKKQTALEHKETVEIVRGILKKIDRPESEERLMTALLSDNPIGKFLEGRINIDEARNIIISMSGQSGIEINSFFDLLLICFMCDAGSYTVDAGSCPSLDYLFEFDRQNRKMSFSKSTAPHIEHLRKQLLTTDITPYSLFKKNTKKTDNTSSSV